MQDIIQRAVGVDNVLHMFFSHPSIEGIILWGFWDQVHDLGVNHGSFVDGDNFVVSTMNIFNIFIYCFVFTLLIILLILLIICLIIPLIMLLLWKHHGEHGFVSPKNDFKEDNLPEPKT